MVRGLGRVLLAGLVLVGAGWGQNGFHYVNAPSYRPPEPKWYDPAPVNTDGPQKSLRNGSEIRIRLKQTLVSGTIDVGERVRFEVLDDVVVDGALVISGGAVVVGGVTKSRAKQPLGRAGRLAVTLDYAVAASGEKVRLRGGNAPKGGKQVAWVGGGAEASNVAFYPAWPVLIFVQGGDAWIPEGLEVTAFVNGDQLVHAALLR